MRVEQLMTKSVRSCHPEDSLNAVAGILWETDCGAVPVTASDGTQRVVGMITDRDVCMAAYTRGKPLAELQVASAMSTSLHCCKPSDTIAEAEEVMRRAQVRRLPVVDDAGQMIGFLSLADIAREAERERASRKKRQVTQQEVAQTLAAISQPHRGGVA